MKTILGSKFKKSLEEVAKQLKLSPQEIKPADYFNSKLKDILTEWELRKLGGFKAAKNIYFPIEKDLVLESASKFIKVHKTKIEKKYGKDIFLKQEFLELFKELLDKNPLKVHKKIEINRPKNKKSTRSLVAHISDTHFGCNIAKNELNALNEFNWSIAARRMGLLVEQIVTYKPQYRDQTELVIVINGDIIAGMIHDQEWGVDLLTTQFAGALSILIQAVSYCAQHFNQVRVVCTPGNHGRAMHKSSTERATVHKWDSYENMIYVALREALKYHKNVSFQIPESPYAIVKIQDQWYLITHGDTVINVGNPGRSLNMRSINEQVNKINAHLLPGEHKFSGILVGHVHVPTVQLMESGTMLLINGTLSGLDAYAQSLGIFNNQPTQTIFEVVPGHAVGDVRIIRLSNADHNSNFEKIIQPLKNKF